MKRIIFVIFLIVLVFAFGCEQKPIGGERDEHGCLGAAGYSYDTDVGACTRNWELDDTQKQAAKVAVAHLSFPVTVVEVISARCPGCFVVTLQRNDNQEKLIITLENWEIKSSAKHICTAEEKQAEICTLDYTPVCGDDGVTYGNACQACGSGEIDSWIEGECEINSFEDCINAGYPAMESYPRQCSTGDKTFTESLASKMTVEEAMELAEGTGCTEKGTFKDNNFFNSNSNTWWIDLDMKPEFAKDICNPACVINVVTNAVEINWRCTGALP